MDTTQNGTDRAGGRLRWVRLLLSVLVAAPAAAAANAVVYLLASAAGALPGNVAVGPEGQALNLFAVISASVIGAIGAAVVLAVLNLLLQRPRTGVLRGVVRGAPTIVLYADDDSRRPTSNGAGARAYARGGGGSHRWRTYDPATQRVDSPNNRRAIRGDIHRIILLPESRSPGKSSTQHGRMHLARAPANQHALPGLPGGP